MNKLIGFAGILVGLSLGAGCMVDIDEPESEELGSVESEVKDKIFCGGFAGIQCPGDLICVDDPSDSCNPKKGGADCGGICKKPKGKPKCQTNGNGNGNGKIYVGTSPEECATIKFVCDPGYEYFADSCGCGCQPTQGGVACGPNTCTGGMVCCNASCGICTPPGGFCTQQACL